MFSSLNWKIKIRVSYDLAQSSRIKPNRSIRLYISYFSFLIKATWDDCMCLVIERVGHNKSASEYTILSQSGLLRAWIMGLALFELKFAVLD